MPKELLSSLEQFETVFDAYLQKLQKSNDEIYKNVSAIWNAMQESQKEKEGLLSKISEQNAELNELRTKSEELDKTIAGLKAKRDELNSKITELNNNLENSINELKKPQFELEDLTSKLNATNDEIATKDSEKSKLDQNKIANENKEKELNEVHATRMKKLEEEEAQLKQNNFFTQFVINNSPEEIIEVDIIATILEKGKANIDELKKIMSVPPIMAVRTIKQLAVKGIVKLDESTNEVSIP